MTTYEKFINAACAARDLADAYRDEAAETACDARRERCLQQADAADERADDYEMRASWYAPKVELENAA